MVDLGDKVARITQLFARYNLPNIDETCVGWKQVFRLAAQRDEDVLASNKVVTLASRTSLLAHKLGEIEDARFRTQVCASGPINNCAPKCTIQRWQRLFRCTEFGTVEKALGVHALLLTEIL